MTVTAIQVEAIFQAILEGYSKVLAEDLKTDLKLWIGLCKVFYFFKHLSCLKSGIKNIFNSSIKGEIY